MKDFPQLKPGNSVVIGDSLSDIQAGRRLGMKTIFIEGRSQIVRSREQTLPQRSLTPLPALCSKRSKPT